MGLTVVVITKDEEANIERCLESVAWADELIVVDSQSTDRTAELARRRGAVVCDVEWRGFGPAKRRGVALATQEWVLSLDADEVVGTELAHQIRQVAAGGGEHDGYYVGRRTNFLGRWISHCGWYPDPVLRLFRREKGNVNEAVVHEQVEVDGSVGRLSGELLHFSYPTLEHYLAKSAVYTTLGAREAFRRGRRARWYDLVIRPPISFFSHYIVRQGFRDGMEGWIISVMSAVAVFVKYAKLRHLQRTATPEQREQYGFGD
ncbi:MAG TPA: glycosyltransferase family 2 protein [candidate division Zixibacteria bacterium]|nr:glycosyltransferase family 2 protein [candidate division Zixibacteria bacterium]MDD4918573.1 glycosyltransferase family 2 protein [candidate division Zixibacteria bacterium]MDM7971966.1 glycosyltransferase family 2 protein [candidate division Zixibacteria bacterium]HOD65633.1 glycosyltransferase family 2 protein [candidate division Zixibacteria bacterium]HPI32161.1 glycosyltransferase family 2 protein [candidate division Zixibacteria bacterium]